MAVSRSQINQAILVGLQANYGSHVQMGVQFEVTPNQVQTFEEKKRQQFAFLNEIDFFPTDLNSGQIIAFNDSDIADRSRKSGSRTTNQVDNLVGREFKNRNIEQDIGLPWAEQVQWGNKKAQYYDLWRTMCLRKRSRGLMRVMFNGQTYLLSNNSNLTNYPLGEDVQRGILQYMLEEYPENVIGIELDNVNGTIIAANGDKYKVKPINIGVGGDYENLADLAQEMRNKVEFIYRGDRGIKAIVGDSLAAVERKLFLNGSGNDARKRDAAEMLLANMQLANMQMTTPDEFPLAGLCVTNPKNIQYVYQTNSVYREFREWSDAKETQDLLTMDRDFVVPYPEAFVMLHPDAARVKVDDVWVEPAGWTEWSIV
jgi:hypothetical protein